jgi:hypothetical protein
MYYVINLTSLLVRFETLTQVSPPNYFLCVSGGVRRVGRRKLSRINYQEKNGFGFLKLHAQKWHSNDLIMYVYFPSVLPGMCPPLVEMQTNGINKK